MGLTFEIFLLDQGEVNSSVGYIVLQCVTVCCSVLQWRHPRQHSSRAATYYNRHYHTQRLVEEKPARRRAPRRWTTVTVFFGKVVSEIPIKLFAN